MRFFMFGSLGVLLAGCSPCHITEGPYLATTFGKEANYLEKLDHQGVPSNTNAQFIIGRNYLIGEKEEKDIRKGLYWYENIAANNHPCVLNNLSYELNMGHHTPRDYERAFKLVNESAKSQHPVALVTLGEMYYLGQGTPLNKGKALQLFEKALAKGAPQAAFSLGRYYFERNQRKDDRLIGYKWLHVYALWVKENDFSLKNSPAERKFKEKFYEMCHRNLSFQQQAQAQALAQEWYHKNKQKFLRPQAILKTCKTLSLYKK